MSKISSIFITLSPIDRKDISLKNFKKWIKKHSQTYFLVRHMGDEETHWHLHCYLHLDNAQRMDSIKRSINNLKKSTIIKKPSNNILHIRKATRRESLAYSCHEEKYKLIIHNGITPEEIELAKKEGALYERQRQLKSIRGVRLTPYQFLTLIKKEVIKQCPKTLEETTYYERAVNIFHSSWTTFTADGYDITTLYRQREDLLDLFTTAYIPKHEQ